MAVVAGAVVMLVTRGSLTFNIALAAETLVAFIRTKPLDFGSPDAEKELDQLLTVIENTLGLQNMVIDIYAEDANDQGSFLLADTVKPDADGLTALRAMAARRFKFEFRDNGVQEQWNLNRFSVFGEVSGEP